MRGHLGRSFKLLLKAGWQARRLRSQVFFTPSELSRGSQKAKMKDDPIMLLKTKENGFW